MPSLTTRALLWSLRPLLAGLCLGACTPETPPGTRVDFVFEVDEYELCLGTPAHLDAYIERVFAFLGAEPGDFTVPIHVVASPSCGNANHNGCYHPNKRRVSVSLDENSRYRPTAVLRHEVTHAVVHAAWGRSVSFFEEGFAESLSRTFAVSSEWTPEPQPVLHMLDDPSEQLDYEAAALFIRYLIDRVGIAPFRTIFQKSRGGTRDEIVALIETVTGEEFAALDLELEYLGS